VARRQVKARLRAVQRALEAEAPLLLDFLGWPDPKRPPPPVDDGARRARLFTILRRLVQAQSGLEPTVLLLDDVHWVDRDSDAFLAELVDAVGWTRTLVLLNFRPEYSAPWMQTAYYQPLQLAPLDEGASDALLRELLGDAPAVAPVGAAIKERAAGNPFFIEEIVHSLVAQGVLVRERAGWRVTQPVTAVRIPATVQALLGARIDSLPEPAKYVLQTAAVIGKRFAEPVLRLTLQAEASPCGQAGGGLDVAAALRLLQGADLIHAGGTEAQREYVFKHPLTQEVAYAAQLQETRQRMHAAVAGALEVVYADRLGAHAALLAHHWEAANQPYDARLWRRRAALRVTNIQTRRRS
jgi:adenylate cyclase